MVGIFGDVAGNDPSYNRLVDDVAAFVSERTSEGQGALVLLKRAEQLDFDDSFEMIRLLGKAAHQLSKKEYAGSLIKAMRLMSLAYRSAGLLWAARASCVFAIASIFIEAEEDSAVPASVVPTLMLLSWITVELHHLPDAFEAIRLVRGCIAQLPFDDASKERAAKRLQDFDLVLASMILNFTPSELNQAAGLPDVLDGLGMHQSRTSLLYALGYEPLLRHDGSIPAEKTPAEVAELFTLLASQPTSDNLRNPVTLNEPGPQIYVSTVLGIRVEVHHQGSEVSILAAEAVIGSIEALFATAIDLDAAPHAEVFTVMIEESADATLPDFTLDEEQMTATIRWPADRLPATYSQQGEVQKMLVGLAATIFAATCLAPEMMETLTRLLDDDAVLDHIAMIAVVGNSHQRFLNSTVSRLSDWTKLVKNTFSLQAARPNIVRRKLGPLDGKEQESARPATRANLAHPRIIAISASAQLLTFIFGTALVGWEPRSPSGSHLIHL